MVEETLSCPPLTVDTTRECYSSVGDKDRLDRVRDIANVTIGGAPWLIVGFYCRAFGTDLLRCASYATRTQIYSVERWEVESARGTGVFFQQSVDAMGVVDVEGINVGG